MKEDDYSAALDLSLAWTQKHPDSASGYLQTGLAFYYLGRLPEAIAALEKEKQLSHDNTEGRWELASARKTQRLFPDLPPLQPTPSDIQQEAAPWQNRLKGLLSQRRYDEIEKIATELTRSRRCAANGDWHLLFFLRGLWSARGDKRAEALWRSNHALVTQWSRARPQSQLARTVLFDSWISGAWVARGEDYVVASPEKFAARLEAATLVLQSLLDSSKAGQVQAPRSPLFYVAFFHWAQFSGIPRADYEKMFARAIAAYPDCTKFYGSKTNYLLPQWYGEPGEWERFADQSADRLGGEAGDTLYARLVCQQSEGVRAIWEDSTASWPRVKRGLEAILRRYPDSLWAGTELFYLAAIRHPSDVPTALQALQIVGGRQAKGFWRPPGLFAYNRMTMLDGAPDEPEENPLSDGPSLAFGQPVLTANSKNDKPIHFSAPISAGAVGWWTGDGDALDTIKRNDGRAYKGVSYVPGKVGQAFGLDGAGGYVKVPTSDLNPGSGPGFTVELWIRPDDVTQKRPIAGWSGTSTPGVSLWLEPAADGQGARLGADLRETSGASHRLLAEGPLIVAGEWQHVALVYRRDRGLAALFLNGNVVRERHLGDLQAQTGLDFLLGKHAYIDGGASTFRGALDEASVYNRALDTPEIQAIYLAASAGKQLASESDAVSSQEQRQTARLSSIAVARGGAVLNFCALIDGSDLVHLKGNKVWYEHRSWSLPGQGGGENQPTHVNGVNWFPSWNGNDSDFTTLPTGLPQSGMPRLSVDVLGGDNYVRNQKSALRIVQMPTAANGYEAVLLLDDDKDAGAHWCVFSLAWSAAP